ncbi:MAG: peptide chain release factor N(5)-glutamine methyltransferase [Betaproteobacteria bacterium]|nr:MAG: peptide chain release factor N(5)-glutamine methyltransferase [Betaproteobacteria bacterium]
MSLTITQALATAQLDPVDARALLRHVLGVSDAHLIAHSRQVLSDAQSELFAALAARRSAGEPVAYIVGAREFFSLEFKVTPAVLIPRPETETLVEFALERIAPDSVQRVLDLGTGSGCIAISIAKHRPRARVVAVDCSTAALAVARENAQRHAVPNLELAVSDWFGALAGRKFDLIVSNPPYVAAGDPHLAQGDLRFEPPGALAAGADGLDCVRLIIASAPQYLSGGGWLAFEHGYDQAAHCRELLAKAGFGEVFSLADLAGIERVSGGVWYFHP